MDPDRDAVWVTYGEDNSYTDDETRQKMDFVAAAAETRHWGSVWDLGCNDGRFSDIASRHADHVVAVDGDEGIVEVLYRRLQADGRTDILPLTVNLTDPSPDRGWPGASGAPSRRAARRTSSSASRSSTTSRSPANVPIPAFLDWLRSLDAALVIELPLPDDVMVRQLLAAKREGLHTDYTREHFEESLAARFTVERTEELAGGTRVLYLARPERDRGRRRPRAGADALIRAVRRRRVAGSGSPGWSSRSCGRLPSHCRCSSCSTTARTSWSRRTTDGRTSRSWPWRSSCSPRRSGSRSLLGRTPEIAATVHRVFLGGLGGGARAILGL